MGPSPKSKLLGEKSPSELGDIAAEVRAAIPNDLLYGREFLDVCTRAADSLGVPPSCIAHGAKGLFSVAIGPTARVRVTDSFAPTLIVWTLSLASSGFGKSNAVEYLNAVLSVFQAIAHQYLRDADYQGDFILELKSTMRTASGLFQELQDQNQHSRIQLCDEITTLLDDLKGGGGPGGGDGPMRGLLLGLRAGGEAVWGTKSDGSRRLDFTHFILVAFGQPAVLMEHVFALHNSDGLWFRMGIEIFKRSVSSFVAASAASKAAAGVQISEARGQCRIQDAEAVAFQQALVATAPPAENKKRNQPPLPAIPQADPSAATAVREKILKQEISRAAFLSKVTVAGEGLSAERRHTVHVLDMARGLMDALKLTHRYDQEGGLVGTPLTLGLSRTPSDDSVNAEVLHFMTSFVGLGHEWPRFPDDPIGPLLPTGRSIFGAMWHLIDEAITVMLEQHLGDQTGGVAKMKGCIPQESALALIIEWALANPDWASRCDSLPAFLGEIGPLLILRGSRLQLLQNLALAILTESKLFVKVLCKTFDMDMMGMPSLLPAVEGFIGVTITSPLAAKRKPMGVFGALCRRLLTRSEFIHDQEIKSAVVRAKAHRIFGGADGVQRIFEALGNGSNDFGDNHEVIPKLGETRQEGGNLVFKKLWPMDREGLTELIDKLRDLDMELSSFHPEGAKLISQQALGTHPLAISTQSAGEYAATLEAAGDLRAGSGPVSADLEEEQCEDDADLDAILGPGIEQPLALLSPSTSHPPRDLAAPSSMELASNSYLRRRAQQDPRLSGKPSNEARLLSKELDKQDGAALGSKGRLTSGCESDSSGLSDAPRGRPPRQEGSSSDSLDPDAAVSDTVEDADAPVLLKPRYPVSPTEERYLADIARYQDTEEWADKGEDALKAHIKKLHKRRMKTKEAKDNKNAADAQAAGAAAPNKAAGSSAAPAKPKKKLVRKSAMAVASGQGQEEHGGEGNAPPGEGATLPVVAQQKKRKRKQENSPKKKTADPMEQSKSPGEPKEGEGTKKKKKKKKKLNTLT